MHNDPCLRAIKIHTSRENRLSSSTAFLSELPADQSWAWLFPRGFGLPQVRRKYFRNRPAVAKDADSLTLFDLIQDCGYVLTEFSEVNSFHDAFPFSLLIVVHSCTFH
jgi:hypothetical protein